MAVKKDSSVNPSVSRDEVVGYHKGCLNTLVSERNELLKIVQITESLMQAHLKALKDLGIKVETQTADKSK
ncbi:MAG: hypothetical protein AABW73_03085 [Nanoarchaeota archaeon]